jgi:TRAP-type uncharacterized transport system fused permease subunit
MFAFYFAILSAITPPVALAVFAAAGLAKANMWASGFAAMRAAAPAYIVPFMFVYEPSLLLIGGDWLASLGASVTAIAGVVLLAAGLFGYFLHEATPAQRALLVAAALLLIKPGWITDLAGAGIGVAVALMQLADARRRAAATPAPSSISASASGSAPAPAPVRE